MRAPKLVVVSISALALSLPCRAQVSQAQPAPPTSIPSATQTDVITVGKGLLLPPTPSTQPVDDYVKYRFFFQHIENLDKAAAHFESLGKDGSGFRQYEQQKAKLTDAEGASLKQVALDCNRAIDALNAKEKGIIDSLRLQYPHTPLYKIPALYHVPLPPELAQFDQQKKQVINDHIAQLKSLLGDASFQKLDDEVQNRIHPRIFSPGQGLPGQPVGVKVGQVPALAVKP